jgi:hypothetical protein
VALSVFVFFTERAFFFVAQVKKTAKLIAPRSMTDRLKMSKL